MPMENEASERLISEGKSTVDVAVQDVAQRKGVIGQLLRLRRLCGLHWCHLASWNGLKSLALGQLLAILLTTTGVTSSLLAQRGVDAPTTQSFFNYLLLAVVYGSLLIYRGKPLQTHWAFYFALACIDVEANFVVVSAYQYTSLTSVALLDCFTIPAAMALTVLLLHTRYSAGHGAGVALCVTGLFLVFLSDVHAGDGGGEDGDGDGGGCICSGWTGVSWGCGVPGGSNVLLGDGLVVVGSVMYAITNVAEEYLAKQFDPSELLAMLGLFGSGISGIQLFILERGEVTAIHWTAGAVLPFIVFAAALFAFYSLVPRMLQMSGCAMLNLSLLMSDIWAVAIRSLVFHQKVDWVYFLAFGTVVVGLGVYSASGEPMSQTRSQTGHTSSPQNAIDDEERTIGAQLV